MTDIRDLYRTIGQHHCRLGQFYIALANHLADNPEPRPESEPPPEMTVHAPSTVPPEFHGFGADDGPHYDTHSGPLDSPALEDVPSPASGKRLRTDYTAAEWASSSNFSTYMKKAPFNTWSAEEQNRKRDEFSATHKDSPRMNRWGQRFEKFCGVAS